MSAHLIDIDDAEGQVVDRNYYCSDACAQTDENYKGWNGCHEIYSPELCGNCSKGLVWYNEDEKTWQVAFQPIKHEHDGYWSLFGTYNCYSCGVYCESEEEE